MSLNLRRQSPWPIPTNATVEHEHKRGYQQVKYSWLQDGWRYTARFHTPLPTATLITTASWQLTRVRPGKGFGPDHAPRLEQTQVGDHWVPTSVVRYAARQYNLGQATAKQVKLLQMSHQASLDSKMSYNIGK